MVFLLSHSLLAGHVQAVSSYVDIGHPRLLALPQNLI
jgi:hypothetical protein